jgi:hypothetical protein
MQVTSPVTVCTVLSVQRSRHRAICAEPSPAPIVTAKSPLSFPSYIVPIIKTGNSVLHAWSVRALYLIWADVPHARTDFVRRSFNGASGAQF